MTAFIDVKIFFLFKVRELIPSFASLLSVRLDKIKVTILLNSSLCDTFNVLSGPGLKIVFCPNSGKGRENIYGYNNKSLVYFITLGGWEMVIRGVFVRIR